MRAKAIARVLPLVLALAGCGRSSGAKADADSPARPEDVLDFHALYSTNCGMPRGQWTQWAGDGAG